MKPNFLTFRNNALQSLTLISEKQKRRQYRMNKTEIEAWIKSEYERHYETEAVTC